MVQPERPESPANHGCRRSIARVASRWLASARRNDRSIPMADGALAGATASQTARSRRDLRLRTLPQSLLSASWGRIRLLTIRLPAGAWKRRDTLTLDECRRISHRSNLRLRRDSGARVGVEDHFRLCISHERNLGLSNHVSFLERAEFLAVNTIRLHIAL